MRDVLFLFCILAMILVGIQAANATGKPDPRLYNPHTTKARAAAQASASSVSQTDYDAAAASAMVDAGPCHGSLGFQTERFGIAMGGPDQYCRLRDNAQAHYQRAAAMRCPEDRDTKSRVEVGGECVKLRQREYSLGEESARQADALALRQPGLFQRAFQFLIWR